MKDKLRKIESNQYALFSINAILFANITLFSSLPNTIRIIGSIILIIVSIITLIRAKNIRNEVDIV